MDRNWMYDRYYDGKRGEIKEIFKLGVALFLKAAKRSNIVISEGGIRCPCASCDCRWIRSEDEIKYDLYTKGFRPNYWIWTSHGETIMSDPPASSATNFGAVYQGSSSSSAPIVPAQNYQHYPLNEMNHMITDALGIDTNEPLFEDSTDSKLTVCVRLLGIKCNFLIPELAMDAIAKLVLDTTPIYARSDFPRTYYEAKQLVSKLGLGVKRIHCCINGCMLFYNNEFGVNDGDLVQCKFCQEPRYRQTKNSRSKRGKPVPRQAMFYLPIVSRSGELRHPSDGLAWKHFDQVNPDFASDPRNVRLGLCSDGFTLYTQASATPYSCWPIIVTPYNLPPEMCMSKPYMFLAAVILGPSSPTVGIDIYLQPLVDDLKRLWEGVVTYDISRKQISS
ncbi:hypothetical protein TSUD_410190 [Trifolium subterraneum]|uniref:Transposase-associated domain-containing protein n=1 Tax=Trifolium subterraneum TaxID=3900 RepID=A0A2Z6PSU4_TRISU|nr:hypothetical protein TSUD_410190 [Trifolium subterraneum]